jgi:carbon-monoxide dehydrogenase small subunit
VCGACTVLIDGAPARACIALTVALEGADIKTLEGLADDERMAVLKDSFHEQHGLQCGFCTPGMLISAWDLLARKPNLSDQDIREAMSGNLCRCTGYQGIVRSIKHAAETLQSELSG